MSTTDPCNCHEAARWKRRALAAELSLAFTKRQLEGVLAVMPGVAPSEPPSAPSSDQSAESGAPNV